MFRTIRSAFLLALLVPFSARAGVTCADVLKALGSRLADHPDCFQSTDLTTNNLLTTPANNSLPGIPPGAFVPITDRAVIAPSAANRPPITKAVPGVQLNARIASDPAGQARFLLRLPDDWNGRLVVAGASGTRSEFNGDFAWSDYVVQQGYAYASQNKGVLNLQLSTSADPLACPSSLVARGGEAQAADSPFGERPYGAGSLKLTGPHGRFTEDISSESHLPEHFLDGCAASAESATGRAAAKSAATFNGSSDQPRC